MKGWSPFTKVIPLKQNEGEVEEEESTADAETEEEDDEKKKGGSTGQWVQGAMDVANIFATGVGPVRS